MELIKQNLFLFNMIQFLASCFVGFVCIAAAIFLEKASIPVLVSCVGVGFFAGFPVAWLVTRRIVEPNSGPQSKFSPTQDNL
jgi:hypothetical protein